MEDVVRRLERLQRGESEEEEKSWWLTRRKQQIWDEQYQQHHGSLKNLKGHYEAGFIIEEILGPRLETPLLDDIATQEQLDKLEEDRQKTDDILGDWHTPPGSPWERDPNQTVDDSSLSWDTDDIAIPDSWDEGEETADEVYRPGQEESNTEGDEDSLPELVSDEADTSEDSGYAFLNKKENVNNVAAKEISKQLSKFAHFKITTRCNLRGELSEYARTHAQAHTLVATCTCMQTRAS